MERSGNRPAHSTNVNLLREGLQEILHNLATLQEATIGEQPELVVCNNCFQEADGCMCPSAFSVLWPISHVIAKVKTELTLLGPLPVPTKPKAGPEFIQGQWS